MKLIYFLLIFGGLIEMNFSPRIRYVKESGIVMLCYTKELEDGTTVRDRLILFQI